ncbi:hypothetical protein ACFSFY_04835 [Sporosarcina siberiensis]|uniref:Lipoprotein n=1 Tax=Sporosarcina siberiensis TaxID=1365606 RepID=A0ABW4SG67_9BACL
MKYKLIPVVILLIIVMSLTGCNKERNAKKYDAAINQVITLENKYLQSEGILNETEILKREDIGIIVYKKGGFISLIYEIGSHKKIESLYKKNMNDNYKNYPNTKKRECQYLCVNDNPTFSL